MRKKSKKSLTRKLDNVFGDIVKSTGSCLRCGKTTNLQCCHVYSRRYRSVRWDIDNAVCMCAGCHMFTHLNPTEFSLWLIQLKGEKWITRLREKAHIPAKRTVGDMQKLYEEMVIEYENIDKIGGTDSD